MSAPQEAVAVREDEAARERASDPRESIVLQAPAGSGKTTVLTQRLLRLLTEVDDPQEILAITFTRRAAAEMRERMHRALEGEGGEGPLGERLRTLAAAVLERSAALGWRLREDPARLRIQTIDAFNLNLANRLPLAARAGGPLTLGERPEALYRLAARETLLAAERQPGLAADADLWFERLDNRWGNLEGLLAEMLAERAHWLPHVLGHAPEALSERVNESLRRVVSGVMAEALACLDAPLHAALERLPEVGPLSSEPRTLGAWQRLAGLALTQKGEWRRALNRSLGPAYADATAREALQAGIAALGERDRAQVRLREVGRLPRPVPPCSDRTRRRSCARHRAAGTAARTCRSSTRGAADRSGSCAPARAARA